MIINRRSVLVGAVGLAAGAALSGCTDANALPSARWVRSKLEKLVKDTGLDAFQYVVVSTGSLLYAILGAEDGGEWAYSHSRRGWSEGEHDERSVLSSPSNRPLADLPLEHLPDYAALTGDLSEAAFSIDHVGHIRVNVTPRDSNGKVGVLADGSGLVPVLDLDTADGVTAAVAELVADYGPEAFTVGSFNGFVYMDTNVEGIDFGLRVVRYPELAADASSGSDELYAQAALVDPTDLDAALVLEVREGIMDKAGLPGKVWDWSYSRPPQGGDPMFSYGVGENGPSQTIWIDADGAIVEIVDGDCAPGMGFCPA